MPVKKNAGTRRRVSRNKLKPNQLEQEAAIAEIEAVLNMEDDSTAEQFSLAKLKRRSVQIKTAVSGSPHVVDLKRLTAERELSPRRLGQRVARLAAPYRLYEHVFSQLLVVNVVMLVVYVLRVISRPLGYVLHTVTTAPVRALGTSVHAARRAVEQAEEGAQTMRAETTGWIKKLRSFRLPSVTLRFLPPHSWQRQLAAFVMFAVILVIPLKIAHYAGVFGSVKGAVLGESEQAFSSLEQALGSGGALDFVNAADSFATAAFSFGNARAALDEYAEVIALAHLLPGKKARAARSVEALLQSAAAAARAGEHLARAFTRLELSRHLVPSVGAAGDDGEPLTVRLAAFGDAAGAALQELETFRRELAAVDADSVTELPADNAAALAARVRQLQGQADALVAGVRTARELAALLSVFLGHEQDTRYLVVFQNNAELRASGGFIGSYALADFRRGAIKQVEVPGGGSYDLQGGLHERLAAPQPLHLINSLWEFQDANWWPDWPRSARQLEWFFENGWGSSVDGVIALDPTFVEQLLKVTGPIDMTREYGTVVTSENFYDVVQRRDNLADETKPKTIISDLVAALADALPQRVTPENLPAFVAVAERALAEKHVLLYLHEPLLQAFITAQGWDGGLRDTDGDYLAVINTNIAGGKTDRAIRQSIAHEAAVTPDGGIINTVTITREHTAGKNDPFAGVRNVNYLRVYVPRGATLLSAEGFRAPDEIYFDEPAAGTRDEPDVALAAAGAAVDPESGVTVYTEFGKTVFAHWSQVDPGKTATMRVTYKLPFKIHGAGERRGAIGQLLSGGELDVYSLLVQKQAGTIASAFSTSLSLPPSMAVAAAARRAEGIGAGGWQLDSDLRADAYWDVVITKK